MSPYANRNLEGDGLAIKITRTALERSGWNLNVIMYPTTRTTRMATAGETDGFIMATTNIPNQDFIYSDSFYSSNVIFVGHNSQPLEYSGPNSLIDLPLGAIAGWGIENAFPNLTWNIVQTPDQALSMLAYGRISAFLYEESAFHYELAQLSSSGEFIILNPMISVVDYGIAVDNTNEKANSILKAFNAGLASMKEDGTLEEIVSQFID